MYKRILLPVFFVCLFITMGLTKPNVSKTCSEFGDPPPLQYFMKGNWNHIMDPRNGCVYLTRDNELLINIVITVAVRDLTLFPDIYYTTEFYGGAQSDLIGPITNIDLVPDTLSTGEIVFTFTDKIYFDEFQAECTENPDTAISFDYSLILKDENGDPYPIEDHYELLIPTSHMLTDENGDLIIPSIVYAGNHDLCCFESSTGEEGGEGTLGAFVQNTSNNMEAENHRINDLGLNENNTENMLQPSMAYPNPFKSSLNLTFPSLFDETTVIQIWDIHGRLVHHTKHLSDGNPLQAIEINTSKLDAGFYYCSLKSNSYSHTFKALKSSK